MLDLVEGSAEKSLVHSVVDEWNKAEKAIKIAEQVNGEIINPSVYELRYAGRRIVEAIWRSKHSDPDKAIKLLNDAHFDCCRARHDAIDAATTKISQDLAIAVKKIGVNVVLEKFTNYSKLIKELHVIRGLVAKSREDRDNRDKIYETVESDNLVTIVEYYVEFQANEGVIRSIGRRQRLFRVISVIAWILTTGLALAAYLKG